MGNVYREAFTKPLPPGAEMFVRKQTKFARWKDAKGKSRTAALTEAGNRIITKAATYTAKYRDADEFVRKVATGCHDEQAATQYPWPVWNVRPCE